MSIENEIKRLKKWADSPEGKLSLEKQAKEFAMRRERAASYYETEPFLATYHALAAHLVEKGSLDADDFHYNPENVPIKQREFDDFIDSLVEKHQMLSDLSESSIGHILYKEIIITWIFGQGCSVILNLKADVDQQLISHLLKLTEEPETFLQVPIPKQNSIDQFLESVGFKKDVDEFRSQDRKLVIKLKGDGIYCYTDCSEEEIGEYLYLEMHLNFCPEPWLLKVILERMDFIKSL